MYNFKLPHLTRPVQPLHTGKHQRGVTLVELMIGIFIGLLLVTAALATLVLSRITSGTVNDVSQLQQQAAYVFNIIGQQLSQAGTIGLTATPYPSVLPDLPSGVVLITFDNAGPTAMQGIAGSRTGTEDLITSNWQTTDPANSRDCLGNAIPLPTVTIPPTLAVVVSQFSRNATTNELVCSNTATGGAGAQALAGNVAEFNLRYGVQVMNGATVNKRLMTAAEITALGTTAWDRVDSVEVCLHLQGEESNQPVIAGSTYTNCQGAVVARDNRLRYISSRTFFVRSRRN